jgi:hypothetical protein
VHVLDQIAYAAAGGAMVVDVSRESMRESMSPPRLHHAGTAGLVGLRAQVKFLRSWGRAGTVRGLWFDFTAQLSSQQATTTARIN